MKQNDLIVLGMLTEGVWAKRYEEIRRIYSIDGISPTLSAGRGGGVEPKILINNEVKDERKQIDNGRTS